MNLRHKLTYTALGGIIAVCGMLSTTLFSTTTDAQHGDATFDTITARNVNIVDDDGKLLIRLSSELEDSGGISIYDKRGKRRMFLAASVSGFSGSYLVLSDKNGTNRTILSASNKITGLDIRDKDGESAVSVTYRNTYGGAVIVRDSSGNVKFLD